MSRESEPLPQRSPCSLRQRMPKESFILTRPEWNCQLFQSSLMSQAASEEAGKEDQAGFHVETRLDGHILLTRLLKKVSACPYISFSLTATKLRNQERDLNRADKKINNLEAELAEKSSQLYRLLHTGGTSLEDVAGNKRGRSFNSFSEASQQNHNGSGGSQNRDESMSPRKLVLPGCTPSQLRWI